jgi:glucose dehydrogenase
MNQRDSKWVRVEPGTVVAKGQPYRIETGADWSVESVDPTAEQVVADFYDGVQGSVFVDSNWTAR